MDYIRKQVDEGNLIWIEVFKKCDANLLADRFHVAGAILGANGKVIEGREAIRQYLKTWMQQIGPSIFTIETIDLYNLDGEIYEKGAYTLVTENGNQYEGKYIVEWKLVGEHYYFYRDIGI